MEGEIHFIPFSWIYGLGWIWGNNREDRRNDPALFSLQSCLSHMPFQAYISGPFLTFGHPKDCTRNNKIPNNGIYPSSSEIRQTSKHVPAGDIKHVKATKVPPLPYLPCPIGPCGAFGSSGTSGAFGAFGGFGASGTSTCISGAHNASSQ